MGVKWLIVKLEDFNYLLPKELIADRPIDRREDAKLMVVDKMDGTYQQLRVESFLDLLNEEDVLVLNDTKVFPARLFGSKDGGGKVEILLVRPSNSHNWWCMHRGSLRVGNNLVFSELSAVVVSKKDGLAEIKFDIKEDAFDEWIEKNGHTPLPPYIKMTMDELEVRGKYQTIFARYKGSVAAPTAGFHFSREMLNELKSKGVGLEFVTLHVGPGTFLGVKTDKIEDHQMHSEWYELKEDVTRRLNEYKKKGKRIIAVGTTATRVLESCVDDNGLLKGGTRDTDIFIYPPYKFKFVDSLITNFHIPKSTLIMLVSAFVSRPNGKEKFEKFETSLLGKVYSTAIKQKFRFFSFGDAMFIC